VKALRAFVVFVVDDGTDEALTSAVAARNELRSWLEHLGARSVAVAVDVVEVEVDDGGRP
jgi:hypothetical protein